MPNALLLAAWVDGTRTKVVTSFRYATDYVAPSVYTGNATLTEISHAINATHYDILYRCQGCWSWTVNGTSGAALPGDTQTIGWAQASKSPAGDVNDANAPLPFHNNGQGIFGAQRAQARQADYMKWTALAKPTNAQIPSTCCTTQPGGLVGGSTGGSAQPSGAPALTAPANGTGVVSVPSPNGISQMPPGVLQTKPKCIKRKQRRGRSSRVESRKAKLEEAVEEEFVW